MWLAGLVLSGVCILNASGQDVAPAPEVQRETICTLQKDIGPLSTDAEARHVWGIAMRGGHGQPWLDGRGLSAKWQAAESLQVTADGQHTAFVTIATGPKKVQLVVDEEPGTLYDRILAGAWFAPLGSRVAYGAQDADGKWHVVVDGQEGPPCDAVLAVSQSPDGRHVAAVVVDSPVQVIRHTDAQKAASDPNPHVYAWAVGKLYGVRTWALIRADTVEGGSYHTVLDGDAGPAYDYIHWPCFSSDGSRLAYVARRGAKWMAVVDGEEGPEFDAIASQIVTFSPEGRHAAYAAQTAGKWVVVVDGAERATWEGGPVGVPVLAADAQHLAFAAGSGDQWHCVLDGEPGPAYQNVERPVFSPDGSQTAYLACRGDDRMLVRDGVEQAPVCRGFVGGSPRFSPDGRHIAYALAPVGGTTTQMYVDGHQVGSRVRFVPQFRPDGTLVFFEEEGYAFKTSPTQAVGAGGALLPGLGLAAVVLEELVGMGHSRHLYRVTVRPQ